MTRCVRPDGVSTGSPVDKMIVDYGSIAGTKVTGISYVRIYRARTTMDTLCYTSKPASLAWTPGRSGSESTLSMTNLLIYLKLTSSLSRLGYE